MLIILDLKYEANSLHFCEEWSSAGIGLKKLTSLSIVLNRNLVIEIFANNLRKVMLSRCFYFFVKFTEQVFIENIISLQFGLTLFALKFMTGSVFKGRHCCNRPEFMW